MFTGLLAELEKNLKRLPGIGSKSAQRLAMFLISNHRDVATDLAESIQNAVDNYHNCQVCNMLTEDEVCHYCAAQHRDDKLLCIVENSQDVFLVENTQEFRGKYFVLNSLLSPMDGVGPEEIFFPQLIKLVKERQIQEVVLALSPSAEGESTISFLADELSDFVQQITRLSTGLPFGGDIEYTNKLTLGNALKRRYSVKD
jgi:recombination protein RecR